jgi:hypothetical protein
MATPRQLKVITDIEAALLRVNQLIDAAISEGIELTLIANKKECEFQGRIFPVFDFELYQNGQLM